MTRRGFCFSHYSDPDEDDNPTGTIEEERSALYGVSVLPIHQRKDPEVSKRTVFTMEVSTDGETGECRLEFVAGVPIAERVTACETAAALLIQRVSAWEDDMPEFVALRLGMLSEFFTPTPSENPSEACYVLRDS